MKSFGYLIMASRKHNLSESFGNELFWGTSDFFWNVKMLFVSDNFFFFYFFFFWLIDGGQAFARKKEREKKWGWVEKRDSGGERETEQTSKKKSV